MQRTRLGSWILGAGTAAMVLVGATATAGAAAPNRVDFAAQYARNAQTEATLLQQAEAAGGSGPIITAYSQTVQTINAQVTVLYGSEQTLATAKSSIPSGNPGERAKLEAERHALTRNIADAKDRIHKERRHGKSTEVRSLTLEMKTWSAQLREVVFELAHPAVASGMWKQHPYAGGLVALQVSILDLQRAAIHYTQLWIAAAKSPIGTAGNPATITGLAYTSASITIPATGAADVTDAVYTAPIVEDAQGNVLTDSGTYAIAGPQGASGVAIDASSGLVTVSPGATAGTYVVTYTQSGASESVNLTVGATSGNPATVTGLAYTAASITIPATGVAAVTDAVSTAPIVENAQGNILADSGSYTIAGPQGATGVAIDASSGLVTVSPAATAGTYVVTYTQGDASESVTLTVSQ